MWPQWGEKLDNRNRHKNDGNDEMIWNTSYGYYKEYMQGFKRKHEHNENVNGRYKMY